MKVRHFVLSRYVENALQHAEHERDENGVVIARVPDTSGFFSQGDTFEEARENLRDAIEGNVVIALQLGHNIPQIEGIMIEEQDAEALAT